jgi:hypothetical protein
VGLSRHFRAMWRNAAWRPQPEAWHGHPGHERQG